MTSKAWNQCTECDRFVPCRRHPDAGCVGPIPDDDWDAIPPWARRLPAEQERRILALAAVDTSAEWESATKPDPCADCSGPCEVCDR